MIGHWDSSILRPPGITAIHQHWYPLSSILSTALPNQLNQFRARNSSLGPCLSTTRLKQGSHEYKNTDNCQVLVNTHTLNVGSKYFCNLRLEDFYFVDILRHPWYSCCKEWSLQACYGAPGAGCGGSWDQLGPSDKFKTNSASTVCCGGSSCHEIVSWLQRSHEAYDQLK